jgi:integrase
MASLKKRGKKFYAQYYLNGEQKRVNLNTTSLQIAREKIRQIESAQFRQDDIPLPTKTPLPEIIEKYLFQFRARSSERNAQKQITYFRSMFGPVCESLKIKNPKIARKAVKRPASPKYDLIELGGLEQLSTERVSEFLANLIILKGISPKTVNHYRQILLTFINWAMREGGVRFPGGKNPVEAVRRYKEVRSDISYLKRRDIEEQLDALADNPLLQTMVATYIFAGLRREEALWLMPSDFDFTAGHYGAIRIRNKEFDGKRWKPKTHTNRTVPVSSELRRYLDRYLENVTPGTWFFHTPEGCRWDPDNFSALLRDVNAKKGLAWSCLDFRHTFGSHLASKGESLYKIAKIMGNSPQICEKHYAALMPECLYDSVEFGDAPQQPAPQPPAPPEPSAAEEPPAENRSWLRLVVNNR